MDQHLLQQLYECYAHELYLYLFSLSGSSAAAEDLVQEAFLKALLALPKQTENLRAWLYTVARNLFFSQRKREKRLTPLESAPELSADDEQAVEAILRDERHRLLFRALQALDPRKREVVELQYFGGLSQKEIAAVLQITPENVRVLAFRARKELKSYMEEQGYDLS